MKKIIFTLVALVSFYCTANSQSGKPKLTNKNSWSMIVLPDPQTYIKFEQNQPIFSLMTRWIKQNKEKLNIKLVLCEGDLVQQNNITKGDGINGNQNSLQQWKAIREAFSVLDTIVPYILCTGNHDYGYHSAENRHSQLNSFFVPSEMPTTKNILAGMMPNAFGEKTLENAYYEFTSPFDVKYLIISLEYNPRKTIVEQTKKLISQEKYSDYRVIILTHSYMLSMNDKNKLIDNDYSKLKDITKGKELWENLIFPSKNIDLVFCGHIAGLKGFKDNVGYRKDKNAAGNFVHQMLFNAQADGGGWNGNGGDGWLRILEFLPDKKTIIIKTYSPLFGISPTTKKKAWRKKSYDNFNIELDN